MKTSLWLCAFLSGATVFAQEAWFDDFEERVWDCDPVCWDICADCVPDVSTGDLILAGQSDMWIGKYGLSGPISVRTQFAFNGDTADNAGTTDQFRLYANWNYPIGYKGQLNQLNGKLTLWNHNGAQKTLLGSTFLDRPPEKGEDLVMQLDVHLEGDELELRCWRAAEGPESAKQIGAFDDVHSHGFCGAYIWSAGSEGATLRYIWISHQRIRLVVPFIRGNANADDNTDIADAVFVLNFLFLGGAAPSCEDAADADDNGSLEITDAVYLLNFLFLGGPPPAAPFPDCGLDPMPDDALTCESFPACADR